MVNCVIALECEARPIIDRFGLKPRFAVGFRVFQSERVRVIISGVGKVAAAAATAWVGSLDSTVTGHAWLNVGVAGHPDRPAGSPLVADRIVDGGTGRVYRPVLAVPPPCPTGTVCTVDRPSTDYPESTAYDMEASGFFPTACRFTAKQLVHCLKIVSDNRSDAPIRRLTADSVTRLVAGQLELVERIIDYLTTLAEESVHNDAVGDGASIAGVRPHE